METKCGNQTLHSKYYLCTKPGCSGAANHGDSELFSVDNFSVRLSFIARKLLLLLSQDRDRPSLEGATLSLCKYASERVNMRSIFLFLYILQGSIHDEPFVGCHMTR